VASPVEQVFISHAEEDADFAQRLADDLKGLGLRIWISPQSILPGEGWVTAIERGLRESSHVVIVLSPDAMRSEWVEKEIEVAITRERKGQINVIPLEVKPCQTPLLLSSYQMVSFQRDYEAGLSRLAGRLGLRVVPSEAGGIERAQPTARRLAARSVFTLAALALLVIGLLAIGVFVSGLIGGRGDLTPKSTTPASVAGDTPPPANLQTQAPTLHPQSTFVSTSVSQAIVTSGITIEGAIAASPDNCIPSDLKALPAHATAIIEPLEGAKSQAPFDTLRYQYQDGLTLSSGITIDFEQMKSFELSNHDFIDSFTADVLITFLDCTTHRDVIQTESGSFLTADTDLGPLQLHFLKIKRVDFEW